MKCPYCGSEEQLVTNKRNTNLSTKNWRRRKCTKCLKVFTTYEAVKLNYIIVVKKNGKKVRFRREKLYASIYNAYLRKKNVDSGDCASKAEDIINRIERELINRQVKEISTNDLRLIVVEQLSKDDFAATLNYISYFIEPKNRLELRKVFRE